MRFYGLTVVAKYWFSALTMVNVYMVKGTAATKCRVPR